MTELGREPTAEEIAEVTGIEPDEVESIKRSAQAPDGKMPTTRTPGLGPLPSAASV